MLSLHHRPAKLCDGVSRRELLRVGGLGMMGLGTMGLPLPSLLRARETPLGIIPNDKTFGAAKSVIYLYLQGGPPQHETFDPKPDAPAEIRGEFQPISTNVPGIQFCELLPRTARIADKLAIVRSLSTDSNVHSVSGAWVQTGYKYQGPNARTIQPTDRPYFGSVVKRIKPSDVLPPLSTVLIPDLCRLNESVVPAGQTGGFMGRQWDPDRFIGDPNDPAYEVQGLSLSDMEPLRLKRRESLLKQINRHFHETERGKDVQVFDRFQQQAFGLLTSGKARDAFAINQEPRKIRERYGRNPWGQCVLLTRRLVEAGVRLVHVNWPRMPGDNAVDNPLWDTHAQNADRLEDVLCPQFDVGFTALIEDLDQRGLLEETLVVAIGEFGRTPKINAKGGRDHWGPVFSFAMAGAGIGGGQVYGASDKQGAYPARDRVEPGQLTATIFHLLGIPPEATFQDNQGREHRLTEGKPLYDLLGTEPATAKRVEPGGDIARVPPYDDRLLSNIDFTDGMPLRPTTGSSRPKAWRSSPLLAAKDVGGWGAEIVGDPKAKPKTTRVEMGYTWAKQSAPLKIAKGQQTLLAQEVRSPFAGTYKLTVSARCDAASPEQYQNIFLKHFTCRLCLFQFTGSSKSPLERKQLASATFVPPFSEGKTSDFEDFSVEKLFVNPKPGSNFSFGLGLGVAVVLEKTSPGMLELEADSDAQHALVQIPRVELQFIGKERNDKVKV